MASSVRLSECIAEALGVPVATALLQMRLVREAGILSQGSRGRNAPRMTTADAAHLLIGVAGAQHVRESVAAVEGFSGLTVVGTLADTPLPGLRAGHRFGEAVTAFIQAFVDDKFRGADELVLTFQMTHPALGASITGIIHDREIKAFYRPPARGERDPPGDLETIKRFTQATIGPVGYLLRS